MLAIPEWVSADGQAGRDGTMNDKTNEAKKGGTDRKDRLAEQLRANLQKRKAQSRSRRTGGADQRPEGLGGAEEIQKD
ncbi:conserved hypothetical protein [Mesorhizobium opportunistum WSM2075]|uniref:Uncharacterized protein n=2 Tax=Phyllobacteriaceae TaxID=69277 RepID=F7XZK2_MESOW|nr:conserved hypothetical protein [Mesorhizobium opportunistum WSM2075]